MAGTGAGTGAAADPPSEKTAPRPFWRAVRPQAQYDAIIVGGGGHGLATAYTLARDYGPLKIAVLEKGWIGGGNTGRNTTIVRSNYLNDASARLYDHALTLWQTLSRTLRFNVMFSPRGVMNLAHDRAEMAALKRRTVANRLNGVDAEWLDRPAALAFCPLLNRDPTMALPILGATLQRRAGVARHDAVAWGYARAADRLGVDIVENCPVTAVTVDAGRVTGVETALGPVRADKVALVTSGHTSLLAASAGLRLPLSSHPLQALVSEPLKPVLHTVVMSNAVHAYISQSDKGELVIGAGIDPYPSYRQAGSFAVTQETVAAILALMPRLSRVAMLRQWAGTVDICPDASPLITTTPVAGLFVNAGWGTGGFKATPGSGDLFARLIATGAPCPLTAPFDLRRFETGALVAEHGAAAVAH